jgi:hypothetical protein
MSVLTVLRVRLVQALTVLLANKVRKVLLVLLAERAVKVMLALLEHVVKLVLTPTVLLDYKVLVE